MKQTKENKTTMRRQFSPRIIVGIVDSTDFRTLQKLKDIFGTLGDFTLIYLRTFGNLLYITDSKPFNEHSRGEG